MVNDLSHTELLARFLQGLKIKNFSLKSIETYRNGLINFLNYIEGRGKSFKTITKQDIISYGLHLKLQRYSPNTVERYLNSTRKLFQWLEESQYILINPLENLVIPRPRQKIPIVLTEKEVIKIIEQPNVSTPAGIRDRAILEVLYSTGIRIGELINLTIFDIDTTGGFLRVNKGKFSKDRFTPLTKAACYWLRQYITNVRPRFTKNRPGENSLFVGNQRGRKIEISLLSKIIKNYGNQAGIKKRVTAHTFRHSFATHLLDNGADILKIQRLLGHSQASITQRYTKVSPKRIKQEHSKFHPREQTRDDPSGILRASG